MPKHIGIVGCSAEGAALCYRTICVEAAAYLGPHAHPEVSLHTHSLARYVECLQRGDLQGVGDLMLSSAEKLAASGAQFLICPDNTIHQAYSYVEERSTVPWLHIAEVAAAAARERGYSCIGITGTRWLVQSAVYPDKLKLHGLEYVRPDVTEIETVDRIIMHELVRGICRPESLACLQTVIRNLANRGCDAVVLGCTELPLILDDMNSPLPTLDSTRLLSRAALRLAVA